MLKTAICELLGIEYPIIQGGMAHLSTAELVSAVANAGGLGIIGAGYYNADWVREQIHLTRQQTSKPFGVNLPLPSPHTEQVIEVILQEKVSVLATGAGNPAAYVSRLEEAGVKVIPVIARVDHARRMEQVGVDVIVAEGTESGGRVGETTTMSLVPQVVDSVRVPVIAAGGISDGRGLVAALALGAQGIQMGTRFVCSDECIAHPSYKQKIMEAHDHSTVVTHRKVGYPLRALQNSLTEQVTALEESGISQEELELFDQGRMQLGLLEGDVEEGSLLAGQIAGMITEIKPVSVIIQEIMTEAETILESLEKLYRVD